MAAIITPTYNPNLTKIYGETNPIFRRPHVSKRFDPVYYRDSQTGDLQFSHHTIPRHDSIACKSNNGTEATIYAPLVVNKTTAAQHRFTPHHLMRRITRPLQITNIPEAVWDIECDYILGLHHYRDQFVEQWMKVIPGYRRMFHEPEDYHQLILNSEELDSLCPFGLFGKHNNPLEPICELASIVKASSKSTSELVLSYIERCARNFWLFATNSCLEQIGNETPIFIELSNGRGMYPLNTHYSEANPPFIHIMFHNLDFKQPTDEEVETASAKPFHHYDDMYKGARKYSYAMFLLLVFKSLYDNKSFRKYQSHIESYESFCKLFYRNFMRQYVASKVSPVWVHCPLEIVSCQIDHVHKTSHCISFHPENHAIYDHPSVSLPKALVRSLTNSYQYRTIELIHEFCEEHNTSHKGSSGSGDQKLFMRQMKFHSKFKGIKKHKTVIKKIKKQKIITAKNKKTQQKKTKKGGRGGGKDEVVVQVVDDSATESDEAEESEYEEDDNEEEEEQQDKSTKKKTTKKRKAVSSSSSSVDQPHLKIPNIRGPHASRVPQFFTHFVINGNSSILSYYPKPRHIQVDGSGGDSDHPYKISYPKELDHQLDIHEIVDFFDDIHHNQNVLLNRISMYLDKTSIEDITTALNTYYNITTEPLRKVVKLPSKRGTFYVDMSLWYPLTPLQKRYSYEMLDHGVLFYSRLPPQMRQLHSPAYMSFNAFMAALSTDRGDIDQDVLEMVMECFQHRCITLLPHDYMLRSEHVDIETYISLHECVDGKHIQLQQQFFDTLEAEDRALFISFDDDDEGSSVWNDYFRYNADFHNEDGDLDEIMEKYCQKHLVNFHRVLGLLYPHKPEGFMLSYMVIHFWLLRLQHALRHKLFPESDDKVPYPSESFTKWLHAQFVACYKKHERHELNVVDQVKQVTVKFQDYQKTLQNAMLFQERKTGEHPKLLDQVRVIWEATERDTTTMTGGKKNGGGGGGPKIKYKDELRDMAIRAVIPQVIGLQYQDIQKIPESKPKLRSSILRKDTSAAIAKYRRYHDDDEDGLFTRPYVEALSHFFLEECQVEIESIWKHIDTAVNKIWVYLRDSLYQAKKVYEQAKKALEKEKKNNRASSDEEKKAYEAKFLDNLNRISDDILCCFDDNKAKRYTPKRLLTTIGDTFTKQAEVMHRIRIHLYTMIMDVNQKTFESTQRSLFMDNYKRVFMIWFKQILHEYEIEYGMLVRKSWLRVFHIPIVNPIPDAEMYVADGFKEIRHLFNDNARFIKNDKICNEMRHIIVGQILPPDIKAMMIAMRFIVDEAQNVSKADMKHIHAITDAIRAAHTPALPELLLLSMSQSQSSSSSSSVESKPQPQPQQPRRVKEVDYESKYDDEEQDEEQEEEEEEEEEFSEDEVNFSSSNSNKSSIPLED